MNNVNSIERLLLVAVRTSYTFKVHRLSIWRIIITLKSYYVLGGAVPLALTSRLLLYTRGIRILAYLSAVYTFFFYFIYVYIYNIQLHFHPCLADAHLRWNMKKKSKHCLLLHYWILRAFYTHTHDFRLDEIRLRRSHNIIII